MFLVYLTIIKLLLLSLYFIVKITDYTLQITISFFSCVKLVASALPNQNFQFFSYCI